MQTKSSDSSEGIKDRRPNKRKIREESSSCETSENVSMKSKDEASLLRRIVRSEMRKFIKVGFFNIRWYHLMYFVNLSIAGYRI